MFNHSSQGQTLATLSLTTMPPKIITTTNLGKTLKVGASAIDVNIDGTSITSDPATGVL